MTSKAHSFEHQLEKLGCCIDKPAWPDKFSYLLHDYYRDKGLSDLRVLSLFSGAGGLDIGFRDAGFEIVESVELEERFCKTLRANSGKERYFPNGQVNCIDIRRYEPKCEDIDFIIGGPPCQTFSAAGRRANGVLGTTDPRGVLFKEYVRILGKIKPTGFLFENVYGIVGAEGGEPWKAIRNSFEDIGYKLFYRVLDAADYGAPQHRERLIIVGLKAGDYLFPRPLFGIDSCENASFYNAGTAIRGANSSHEAIPGHINGRYGSLIDGIPPGLNYGFYTERMGHPNPVFAWRSKFSDFMYKADPERPVRTIKAQGGQYTGPFHWDGRHFTISEYKRLQTFPDDYEVCGGRGAVIHQLGNSVPPQLSRVLALTIDEQVFGRDVPIRFEYLQKEDKLSFRREKIKLTKLYRDKAERSIAGLKEVSKAEIATGSFSVDLDRDFALRKTSTDGNGRYKVHSFANGEGVFFSLEDTKEDDASKTLKYEITIRPLAAWGLPYTRIKGSARGKSRRALTALWKTVEDAIAQAGGAADLVQLSGYYQYRPNLAIEVFSQADSNIDHAIRSTISGRCTRRLMTEGELALLWEVPESSVRECAEEMRLLGFEVRNKRTNPQIPEGKWLVPYEFPTLNPLSVQLRKQV